MNILSISIDFFLTIPGMLILGGILLLIVAVILFIVASVKSKKEDKEETTAVENEVAPVTNVSVSSFDDNIMPVMTPVVEPTVEPANISVEPISFAAPAVEETPVSFVAPVVEEQQPMVVEEPVVQEFMPTVEASPVEIPSFDIPVVQEVTPMASVEAMPTIVPSFEETVSTNEIREVEPIVIPEPEHRPIYGGADPLEATQKMPVIEPTHVPYGGAEVKLVDLEEIQKLYQKPVVEEQQPMVVEETNVVVEPVVENRPVEPIVIPNEVVEQQPVMIPDIEEL
ncbi:MAG: hypothetical protein PHQ64_03095 [Bacilli bacterium]|nr:hypothetical protein [Bacilli bacterium]